jgi:probable rRNA maturation factor
VSIEVNNESGVAVDEVALAELGRWLLDRLRINPLAELSVVLLDTEAMAALHKQWMDLPGPTDVMAFPMDGEELVMDAGDRSGPGSHGGVDSPGMLGDVVLCPEVAATQAIAAGHPTDAELALLCTHGILHLLGYDHEDAEAEREMFVLQAGLVAEWASATGRGPIKAPLPGTSGEVRDTAKFDAGGSGRSR